MGDVFLGYVYDFGTGEEWIGRRGEGATLNGEPLGAVKPKDTIEILAFEATLTSLVAAHASAVDGLAYRLRLMGSLALSLCHLAAGRIDAVCSLEGGALGRHRSGAAPLPGGRPLAPALRRPARLRRGRARSDRTFTDRGSGHT